MGSCTDARIEAFQEKTGIKPAKGEYADLLDELAKEALALIQFATLESSDIRDGDGMWHGSDPLAGTVDNIGRLMERIDTIRCSPDPNGFPSIADELPRWMNEASEAGELSAGSPAGRKPRKRASA